MARRIDSRRLPGVSVFGGEPGAVLDVRLEGEAAGDVAAAWERQARLLADAVGWSASRTASRVSGPDVSLFLAAPFDALYAATEVNELAWEHAAGPQPDDAAIEALCASIADERKPAVVALRDAARARGVAFVHDDQSVSIGMGAGSVTFRVDEVPDPADVRWADVRDVPVVMVTGTNGKTTSCRLLGAIAAAAGRTPGITTTDGLKVGAEAIGSGDYSGPEGARRILRDRRVELAILETARGGIQRRGLALSRIDAAAVTNLAEDHLGEFGIHTLDDIADVKLVVARALAPGAPLVVNADDAGLAARARALPVARAWFSLDAGTAEMRAELGGGGAAAWLDDGRIVLARAGRVETIAPVGEIPVAFGGAARHNVANALTAVLLAAALDVPDEAIARGLRTLASGAEDNPGRADVLELGGVTALVDFAHNPHGMDALVAFARELPAKRRLVVIGQAGDRDDEALREIARAAWRLAPDIVIVKEMTAYLRGRPPGEIPRILEDELLRSGARPDQVVHAESEVAAVASALAWARAGDLLVLPTHSDRAGVLALLRSRV